MLSEVADLKVLKEDNHRVIGFCDSQGLLDPSLLDPYAFCFEHRISKSALFPSGSCGVCHPCWSGKRQHLLTLSDLLIHSRPDPQ